MECRQHEAGVYASPTPNMQTLPGGTGHKADQTEEPCPPIPYRLAGAHAYMDLRRSQSDSRYTSFRCRRVIASSPFKC